MNDPKSARVSVESAIERCWNCMESKGPSNLGLPCPYHLKELRKVEDAERRERLENER